MSVNGTLPPIHFGFKKMLVFINGKNKNANVQLKLLQVLEAALIDSLSLPEQF